MKSYSTPLLVYRISTSSAQRLHYGEIDADDAGDRAVRWISGFSIYSPFLDHNEARKKRIIKIHRAVSDYSERRTDGRRTDARTDREFLIKLNFSYSNIIFQKKCWTTTPHNSWYFDTLAKEFRRNLFSRSSYGPRKFENCQCRVGGEKRVPRLREYPRAEPIDFRRAVPWTRVWSVGRRCQTSDPPRIDWKPASNQERVEQTHWWWRKLGEKTLRADCSPHPRRLRDFLSLDTIPLQRWIPTISLSFRFEWVQATDTFTADSSVRQRQRLPKKQRPPQSSPHMFELSTI